MQEEGGRGQEWRRREDRGGGRTGQGEDGGTRRMGAGMHKEGGRGMQREDVGRYACPVLPPL